MSTKINQLNINKNIVFDDEFLKKIDKIESENLDFVIKRIKKNTNLEVGQINQQKIEFLRFFSLSIFDKDCFIVPPKEVDEFWHNFILFTVDYSNFCDKYLSTYFHHMPSKTKNEIDSLNQSYKETLEKIKKLYPSYSKSIWKEEFNNF